MSISFDRATCCDLNETITREWLITNGLGGYASGTIAGVLTRMQHGLLVAMPPGANQPQLLLAKIDEEITFDRRTYYLGTNEYRDGTISPSGFVHLEAFRMEDNFPTFTYHLGGINGIKLEKHIWMAKGFNTTYIQYRIQRTSAASQPGYKHGSTTGLLKASQENQETHERQPLTITLLPLAACRPYDIPQGEQCIPQFHIQVYNPEETANEKHTQNTFPKGIAGCSLYPQPFNLPYHILACGQPESQAIFIPTGVWYWNFLRRCDRAAGRPDTDSLYLPGVIRATLWPKDNATLTIIISTEELTPHLYQQESIALLYRKNIGQHHRELEKVLQPQYIHHVQAESGQKEQTNQLHILPFSTSSDPHAGGKNYLQQLLNASEHFIVQPKQSSEPNKGASRTPHLIAEYYSMECRTRDTLIGLPGLLLVTKRHKEAYSILVDLSNYFIEGILPDHLPTASRALTDHDYSNADITLWYLYALDHYLKATQHFELLEKLFPRLAESINRYIQGTHTGIRIDSTDGLLIAERPGKALTWMNAYIDGKPVTQRAGKPVEINALWYHALTLMQNWSERLGYDGHTGYNASYYQQHAQRSKHSFQQRFWNAEQGYLYDVIDGPEGNDASLRINQIFALSLQHSIIEPAYRQRIYETITQHLLTPYGLRTLARHDRNYHGQSAEKKTPNSHLKALHQGSSWSWLLSPYIDAMFTQWGEPVGEQDTQLFREYLWRKGMKLLEPLQERFSCSILGMCEGVFDGDIPQQPSSQDASLLSTAELLRIYDQLVNMRIKQPKNLILH